MRSQEYEVYCLGLGTRQSRNNRRNNTLSRKIINALQPGLRGDNLLTRKDIPRGVFLANHLASIDNLTSNNQETEHIQTQSNVNKKWP